MSPIERHRKPWDGTDSILLLVGLIAFLVFCILAGNDNAGSAQYARGKIEQAKMDRARMDSLAAVDDSLMDYIVRITPAAPDTSGPLLP